MAAAFVKVLCANAFLASAVPQQGRWWENAEFATKEEHPELHAIIDDMRSTGQTNLKAEFVSFDDIVEGLPDTYVVQDSWDCLGNQPNSSYVYVCYTAWKNTNVRTLFANQDTLVFRYDVVSKERTFIGTFLEAAAKANNLWKGEIIPKGHTHIINADGHMYIGSQNFHDFKFALNMTELNSYHGGHFFSIDTDTLELKDATAQNCPHGVAVDHEGIVAQSHIAELNLIVGLTHPLSNLTLFNYKTQELERVVQGIPWVAGNPLSREIVALPNGHVYLYRGVEDPRAEDPDVAYPVWMYDHSTGKMGPTDTTMSNGIWDSHAYKRDGSGIYIASSLGELWYIDTATEKWTSLGTFLDKSRLDKGIRIASLYTIALNPEEEKLYGIVSFYYPKAIPQLVLNGGDLFVKDLKTGEVSFQQFLGHGVYTGSDVTVGNSMLFSRSGHWWNGYWIGNNRLGVLHMDEESKQHVEYV